jgi:transaldolase
MTSQSSVERLWEVNPAAEIWWDSSPLVFDNWRASLLKEAANPAELAAAIDRLYSRKSRPSDNLFRGVTTNPPLSLNAIKDNPSYWADWISTLARESPGPAVESVYWQTYKEIVRRGALTYQPLFEDSKSRHGFISGQVDPRDRHDAERMLAQGLELHAIAPNVMVKVPGTAEGYDVVRKLTARGIATNLTLSFIIPQFVACMDAVCEGLAEARRNGVNLTRWRSVITAMSARFGSLGDLQKDAAAAGVTLSEADVRWAEIAIFKKAYRLTQERKDYPGKMLLCSMRMGPKDDARAQSWHVEKVAGADVVYTCPPSYLQSLLVEGSAMSFRNQIDEPVPPGVMKKLLELPYFRRGYAEDGYTLAEFNTHPALTATGNEFEGATRRMVEFVAKHVTQLAGVAAST